MELKEHTLNSFYRQAIAAVSTGISLQDFTQFVFDTFHLPVIVVDVGYQILSHAGCAGIDEPYWNAIIHNGLPSNHTIVNHYLKEGYLDAISQSGGSIYVNWGICKDYPQTSGPIYIDERLEGFVSLLFMNPELKDFSLELNSILCQLCSIILRADHFPLKQTGNPIREVLALKIFNLKNHLECPDLEGYRPFIKVDPRFLILVLKAEHSDSNVLEHVRGRIKSICSDMLYIHRDGQLYLFIYNLGKEQQTAFLEKLSGFLVDYQLYAGFGQSFQDISKRAVYIQQAEYALEAGISVTPAKRLFNYEAYYVPIMFLKPASEIYFDNAVPAEIRLLHDLDCKHHADYIRTLKTYFHLQSDINKAAAELHLHRNTLKYRLDKIESLIGESLVEPHVAERLQIGIHLLELKRITKANPVY